MFDKISSHKHFNEKLAIRQCKIYTDKTTTQ